MKPIMVFLLLAISVGPAFAVDMGEDQKGKCIYSSQHQRGHNVDLDDANQSDSSSNSGSEVSQGQ